MKHLKLSLVALLIFIAGVAQAQAPRTIGFEGLLNKALGSPVKTTTRMTFSLYGTPTGGSALWSEMQDVPVFNGIFSVAMGSVTPLPATISFNKRFYLGVRVQADFEMTPRLAVNGAPYTLAPTVGTPALAVGFSFPKTIYALEGREMNVFWDGCVRTDSPLNTLSIAARCDAGNQESSRWTITPTTKQVGDHPFSLEVWKDGVLLGTGATTLRIVPKAAGTGVTRQLLFIGDSTTAPGTVTAELLKLMDGVADPMKLTTVGTKGKAPNWTEAINGWTIHKFLTDATSPFVFNGAFNFPQYLSTNKITLNKGDWVLIHLGINDVFPYKTDDRLNTVMDTMKAELDTILTAIKATVPGIRIGLCPIIAPAATQEAFGIEYGCGLWRERYKRNRDLWCEYLIANWDNRQTESLYIVPYNLNLDTANNYPTTTVAATARNATPVVRQNNAVHPAVAGYLQMADTIHAFLKAQELP